MEFEAFADRALLFVANLVYNNNNNNNNNNNRIYIVPWCREDTEAPT